MNTSASTSFSGGGPSGGPVGGFAGATGKFISAALIHSLASSSGSSGEGVVLRYCRGDGAALVLFGDPEDSEPLFTPLEMLVAVEEVPPCFRGVAVSGGRLIRTLKRMVHVSPTGNVAPFNA